MNVSVTVVFAFPAMRSAVAIWNATDVTRPLIAPDDTARLTATSAEVCTDTPSETPSVASPIDTPCTVTTTWDEVGMDPDAIKTSDVLVVEPTVSERAATLLTALEGVTSAARKPGG